MDLELCTQAEFDLIRIDLADIPISIKSSLDETNKLGLKICLLYNEMLQSTSPININSAAALGQWLIDAAGYQADMALPICHIGDRRKQMEGSYNDAFLLFSLIRDTGFLPEALIYDFYQRLNRIYNNLTNRDFDVIAESRSLFISMSRSIRVHFPKPVIRIKIGNQGIPEESFDVSKWVTDYKSLVMSIGPDNVAALAAERIISAQIRANYAALAAEVLRTQGYLMVSSGYEAQDYRLPYLVDFTHACGIGLNIVISGEKEQRLQLNPEFPNNMNGHQRKSIWLEIYAVLSYQGLIRSQDWELVLREQKIKAYNPTRQYYPAKVDPALIKQKLRLK